MDTRLLDQRKTLQSQTVVKSTDENDEFEKQRTAAIAEVAKTKEVNNYLSLVCLSSLHSNKLIYRFGSFSVSYLEALL